MARLAPRSRCQEARRARRLKHTRSAGKILKIATACSGPSDEIGICRRCRNRPDHPQCEELHLARHLVALWSGGESHGLGDTARGSGWRRLAAGPRQRGLHNLTSQRTYPCGPIVGETCERTRRCLNFATTEPASLSVLRADRCARKRGDVGGSPAVEKSLHAIAGVSLGTRKPPSSKSRASTASSTCRWIKGTPSTDKTFWSPTS